MTNPYDPAHWPTDGGMTLEKLTQSVAPFLQKAQELKQQLGYTGFIDATVSRVSPRSENPDYLEGYQRGINCLKAWGEVTATQADTVWAIYTLNDRARANESRSFPPSFIEDERSQIQQQLLKIRQANANANDSVLRREQS